MKVLSIEIPNEQLFRTHGYLTVDDAIEVNEDVLGLTDTDLETIQRYGASPRRIDISISDEAYFRNSVQEALDETTRLSNGKIVVISLPNHVISEVYVKYAPLEWTKDRFKRVFSWYGDIKVMDYMAIKESDIANNRLNRRERYAGKSNGIMRMRMKIRKPIPSTLSVDHARIEVFYRSQVRTCWKCGHGHNKIDCTTRPKDFINRFSLEEFPLLGEATRQSEAAQQEPLNDDDMDDTETPLENVHQRDEENNNERNAQATEANIEELNADKDENAQVSENIAQKITEEIKENENTLIGEKSTQHSTEKINEDKNENAQVDEKSTQENTEKIIEDKDENAQISERNPHLENEKLNKNNDGNVQGNKEKTQIVSEEIVVEKEPTLQKEQIIAQVHNQELVNENETTITASEVEDENSQLTPGQKTPCESRNDPDDAMICEVAANVETASTKPPEFSQLTQDKDMEKDNRNVTTFRALKRSNKNISSTDEETGDSDGTSRPGSALGRFVSEMFGSKEPNVKKNPKQQRLNER